MVEYARKILRWDKWHFHWRILFYSTSTLMEMRLRLAGLNMRDNASRGKSKFYKNLDVCRWYYCINHLKRKQPFMSFSQGFFTGFILFFRKWSSWTPLSHLSSLLLSSFSTTFLLDFLQKELMFHFWAWPPGPPRKIWNWMILNLGLYRWRWLRNLQSFKDRQELGRRTLG